MSKYEERCCKRSLLSSQADASGKEASRYFRLCWSTVSLGLRAISLCVSSGHDMKRRCPWPSYLFFLSWLLPPRFLRKNLSSWLRGSVSCVTLEFVWPFIWFVCLHGFKASDWFPCDLPPVIQCLLFLLLYRFPSRMEVYVLFSDADQPCRYSDLKENQQISGEDSLCSGKEILLLGNHSYKACYQDLLGDPRNFLVILDLPFFCHSLWSKNCIHILYHPRFISKYSNIFPII
jgi:hypothetical protein